MVNSYKEDERPCFNFYYRDWLSDSGLNLCSRSARSLWLDMLCYMWQATPRGHLVVNGKIIDSKLLSKLTKDDEVDIESWLKELEDVNVFSRLENGIIISRRMIRDEQIRKIKSIAGQKGMKKRYGSVITGDITNDITGVITDDITPAAIANAIENANEYEYVNDNKKIEKIEKREKRVQREEREEKEEIPYQEIIDDLNATINANYRSNSKETRELIRARWNEGFRLEDFKTVHKKKFIEWGSDDKMQSFLRPITLYSKKFESYLNQKLKTNENDGYISAERYEEIRRDYARRRKEYEGGDVADDMATGEDGRVNDTRRIRKEDLLALVTKSTRV